MAITSEEIKQMMADMVAVKRAIDAEWAAGKRDMMRATTAGLADDVMRLWRAIEADDPNAFKVASSEASDHARSLVFHASAWLRQSRAASGDAP